MNVALSLALFAALGMGAAWNGDHHPAATLLAVCVGMIWGRVLA